MRATQRLDIRESSFRFHITNNSAVPFPTPSVPSSGLISLQIWHPDQRPCRLRLWPHLRRCPFRFLTTVWVRKVERSAAQYLRARAVPRWLFSCPELFE